MVRPAQSLIKTIHPTSIFILLIAAIIFLAVGNFAFALTIGDRVQANSTVNVRSTPAGTVNGTQATGSLGTIIGGPQTASLNGTSYTWWNINWDSGVDGWVADTGITKVSTSATLPGAPTDLSAFAGNGQVGLGWNAPSSNGGAAITNYRVFRGTNSSNTLIVTSGGCANLGVALGCTDTGLTNGQSYYYIVSAVNSVGQGAPSNGVTATPVAPVQAPSISGLSPSSYAASNSNQTMTINGSNFQSGATVTFHDPQGNSYVRTPTFVSSSQLSHAFNNDSDVGTWTVFVTNPNAQTSNTLSFTVTTSATLPGAPTDLSAFAGNGQVGLGWNAPSSNGGAAITNYRVFRGTNSSNTLIVTSGGCANLGVALGCTDTGLTNGQSYYYIVSAVNSVGQGAPSNGVTATPVAPVQAPSISGLSPSSYAASNSNQTMTINGSNFQSGATVTFHDPQGNSYVRTPTFVSSSQLSHAFNNDSDVGTWTVFVTNPNAQTSNTLSFTVTTSATLPGAPTDLSAFAGNGQVGLGWNAPSSNGGAAITNYRVFRGTNSSNTLIVTSGGCANLGVALGCTDTGLTNGQSYYYIVSAVNSVGQGAPSNGVTATPVAPVQAPSISGLSPSSYAASNSNQTMTINGSNFQSGATVTFHDPQGNSYVRTPAFVSSSQLSHAFNNDSDVGTWTVFVTNPNAQTSNTLSFTVTTSATLPGAPTDLSAFAGNGQVGLGWNAPSSNGGAAITNYRVFRGTNSSNTLIVTSGGCANLGVALGCTDTGLTNGQSYYYIVSAVNSVGQGAPSNGVTATPVAMLASGTLTANPSTCQVTTVNGRCTISLVWTTVNVATAKIYVAPAIGNEEPVTTINTSLNGTQSYSIEAIPQKYLFQLWDYSSGSRGTTPLASVEVQASGPVSSPSTGSVSVKPDHGKPGDNFTIYGSQLPFGQTPIWIKSQNGVTIQIGTAIVSSEGNFSFIYSSPSTLAESTYSVWAVDSTGKQTDSGILSIAIPTTSTSLGQGKINSGENGDPINTATGNYAYQRTDIAFPGRGLPFAFVRSYNSQDKTPGPLGVGWTHSYMASLDEDPLTGSVTLRMPDGQMVIFDLIAGTYISRYNNVYSKLDSPSAGTFVLTTKTLMTYQFIGGQLISISDRNGNTIQLAYSGNDLTKITDTVGRQISFSYVSGRLVSLTDPVGRTLRYEYDSADNLSSFTDAQGGRFIFTYDSQHQMLTAVDPGNNTFLTNAYDTTGRVISQSDGAGNRWTYAYDSGTLTTTITDPNDQVRSHVHNSNFEILKATDSFGRTEKYEYNDLGNRISVTDRRNAVSRFTYDANGNIITTTDALAHLSSTSYDDHNNLLSKTDALGNTFTYAYDSHGNLSGTKDPLGNQATFSYDSFGQLTSKADLEGHATGYAYDTTGNLVEETDSLGNKTHYIYDAASRRISTTDANGFTTTFSYDSNDNLLSVTDPFGNKTQYGYDANNNRTSIIDQRGKKTTFSYDGNYKLISTTDVLGNKVNNAYDKLRNLISVTNQLGKTTLYNYDSENRLISSVDPIGNITKYEYDENGNKAKITDPLGNATSFQYDALNRQISKTDALGNTQKTEYDELGRISQKIDETNNATSYIYDALGHQTAIRDAMNNTVSFGYDRVGNRLSITDARQKTTQFTYDDLNRTVLISDPLGNTTCNQYDAVGNLVKVIDGNGNIITYQYDGNRRQTRIIYSTGGSVELTYDVAGNRTGMVDSIGISNYVYDDLNRLQSYSSPYGASLGFSYDAASHRTSIVYPGSKTVQYGFDANGQITSVGDWNGFTVNYSYDAVGRIIGASYSNGLSSQYSYDTVGQNLQIQHNNGNNTIYSEATTWSPNGNPISSDISGLDSPSLEPEEINYSYNDANQLSTSTFGTLTSDLNGNVITRPGPGSPTTFAYDPNNRATSIAGPSVNATMKYFGDGKLAELNTSNAPRRFLIDPIAEGNRILAELDSTGGLQRAYAYGPKGMISQISTDQTYPYFHNLQGSTIAISDSLGGVQNSYQYDPFGQKLSSSSEHVENSFIFLGAFSVPSVGQFSITTHRLYDNRQGRFTGADPAGLVQPNFSAYVYASQQPLRLVDPSGLISHSVNTSTGGWTTSDVLNLLQTSGDIAHFTLEHTETGWKLIPLQPGSFRIETTYALPNWLDKLGNVVSLANFGISTAIDFTDPNLSLAERAGNLGDRSAGLLCSTNQYCSAFKLGWDIGTFAYNSNFLGTRTISDAAIDWIVNNTVGQENFTSWSSH
jgi:RHS repeat-associated protein